MKVQVQPESDEEKALVAAYAPDLQEGVAMSGSLNIDSLSIEPFSADQKAERGSEEAQEPALEAAAAEPAQGDADDDSASAGTLPDAWSPEVDCIQCHAVQNESLGQEGCLASVHGALVSCGDCHSDVKNLEHAHRNYLTSTKQPTKLKYAFINNDFCLSCHGSWEDLAQKTADSTACTDTLGTVVNPHALPENTSHATVRCTDCHKMHEAQDEVALATAANRSCIQCHHEEEYVACSTCHAAE